jgi:hypothetical protein
MHNNNKICQQEEEEERENVEVNSIYTRWRGNTHWSISQIPSHTHECKGTISFSRYLLPDPWLEKLSSSVCEVFFMKLKELYSPWQSFSQIHIHKITDLTHLGTLRKNMNLLELMLKPFHASQILRMQKQLKFCSTMGVYENLDLSLSKVVRFLSDPFTRTIIVLGN